MKRLIVWILYKILCWALKLHKGKLAWLLDPQYGPRSRKNIYELVKFINDLKDEITRVEVLEERYKLVSEIGDFEYFKKEAIATKKDLGQLEIELGLLRQDYEDKKNRYLTELESIKNAKDDEKRKIYIEIATQINGGKE